jgi:hypothetical protein
MRGARTVLVVEDGTEYTEAFRRLSEGGRGGPVAFVRAGDGEEARRLLSERVFDAVFLDVVFDRAAPERLAGDLSAVLARFGGDRRRAERHLAESQGFYLLDALAPLIPDSVPVVLAYDFSAEPERLGELRRKRARLSGVPDGARITDVLGLLLLPSSPP